MRQLGNIAAGQTLTFLFSTNDGDGAAIAPSTAGTVSVYQGRQSDADHDRSDLHAEF